MLPPPLIGRTEELIRLILLVSFKVYFQTADTKRRRVCTGPMDPSTDGKRYLIALLHFLFQSVLTDCRIEKYAAFGKR
jgi:hypothetical protein